MTRFIRQTLSVTLSLAVAVTSLGFAPEAEAKRMGGGGSVGRQAPMQRQAVPPKQTPAQPTQPAGQQAAQPGNPSAPAANPAAANPAAAAAQPRRNSWMGPVAGLAAGLGLAALASYLGVGEELMSLMLILLVVGGLFFLFRLFMARSRAGQMGRQPAPAGAGANMQRTQWQEDESDWNQQASGRSAGSLAGQAAQPAPAAQASAEGNAHDPEVEAFLRVARDQFTALQSLWDKGDIESIRGFTTEAMADELENQLAERQRNGQANHTAVVSIETEWLGMEDAEDDEGHAVDEAYIRFNGLIREMLDGAAQPFTEVWTLQKRKDGQSGWLLAGITQG